MYVCPDGSLLPRVEPGIGKSAPTLGTWSMGIPKNAPRKKEALEFIKWALSREAKIGFAKAGGIAVREDALTGPELLEDPKDRWFLAELESSKLGQLRPQMEHWVEVQDVIVPYLHKAFAGEMSLVDALNEAARLVEKLLDAEGYQHKPFTPAK